ncbi:MAG: DoxX family protein [Planctomycetota bacterium]|jgi:putative oxidoreductase
MPRRISNSAPTDTGLLLIRAMVGIVFVFHGIQKLFGLFDGPGLDGFAKFLEALDIPLPMVSAVLVAVTEFAGGLALALGLGVRYAAVPIVITMIVAIIKVHGGAFDAQEHGMEYPLTLACVVAGIGLTGPGRFSLEPMLFPGKNGT